jgi:O-acetyl-ADP-ribose deacetylase (regulator of RNase III)
MTKLIEKTGNIFDTTADAIGHGVNCRGVMGAGIARQFREKYPDMYKQYRLQCDMFLLEPGGCMPWLTDDHKIILNLASQNEPGADARIDWLAGAVEDAVHALHDVGYKILALPQIGCGIGGLQWSDVLPALEDAAKLTSVDIEAWTYAP